MTCIKKFKTIKNFGIYKDFCWPTDLNSFKQYNIIYGWNGVGKTTLSRLFGAISIGSHPDFTNLQYLVEDENSHMFKQGQPISTQIKIFNTEFIANSVNFDTQSSKTISVYLGEENQELINTIKDDENLLKERYEKINEKKNAVQSKEMERGRIFTDIARTISQCTQQVAARNYNKQNATASYLKLTNVDCTLSEDELSKLTKSVSQDIMDTIPSISLDDELMGDTIDNIDDLLGETVSVETIERLKENRDISEWVENGLALHAKYDNEQCEFCGQPITKDRLSKLLGHFNEADAKIKHEVDELAERLRNIYATVSQIKLPDSARFYQEFRKEYEESEKSTTFIIQDFLNKIEDLGKLVISKKANTTIAVNNSLDSPDFGQLKTSINEINLIIEKHNTKTANFTVQIKADSDKIERHYLCEIRPEVQKLDNQIASIKTEIRTLEEGNPDIGDLSIQDLKARIASNKSKVSSTQKACDILNDSLHTFLGRNEITFTINDSGDGYEIMRCGSPARNLSEGERTAIAFVFFITTLQDENFSIEDGIIVIDDPVSSLDSNSQFQAFAFLKEATKNAGQLFLLTHNFDFLKLAINWLKGGMRGKYSLFMIKNTYSDDNERNAKIDKLDPALEKFESEYHYLFNVLKEFKSDGTIENVYHIPNTARKLLDSFLMFCIPKNIGTYDRLKLIKFDETKKSAIYKFVNDESHITGKGFDPALVPETQKCLKYLFEMMESTFPDHYNYLLEEMH